MTIQHEMAVVMPNGEYMPIGSLSDLEPLLNSEEYMPLLLDGGIQIIRHYPLTESEEKAWRKYDAGLRARGTDPMLVSYMTLNFRQTIFATRGVLDALTSYPNRADAAYALATVLNDLGLSKTQKDRVDKILSNLDDDKGNHIHNLVKLQLSEFDRAIAVHTDNAPEGGKARTRGEIDAALMQDLFKKSLRMPIIHDTDNAPRDDEGDTPNDDEDDEPVPVGSG